MSISIAKRLQMIWLWALKGLNMGIVISGKMERII